MADARSLPPEGAELIEELAGLFRESEGIFGCDDMFDYMARRVHAVQRATNPVLRRFWDASGGSDPGAWHRIPPVPVAAFRDVPISSGPAEVVFRTSGTTSGATRRGEHHVASVDLYRAAARANYRRHLFGEDGAAKQTPGAAARTVAVVSLIAHPTASPDSSLSAMAGFIAREPEVAEATWAFHPRHGVDGGAFKHAARAASHPVLLLTTAFALVQLLDALGDAALPLPRGSGLMETGGFKGRVAAVDRAALYRRVRDVLAIPESHIVNEYGMTEMLSQAYDGATGHAGPASSRVHRFPPWVRTRALDPLDLTPLPPGDTGLLAHCDLANAASVCHLLTEDLGAVTEDGGVRIAGRAPGSDLRGCSLTAESFLRATRGPGKG